MNFHQSAPREKGAKFLTVMAIALWATLAAAQQGSTLKSFTITQPFSAGGESATGTITLTAAAPAQGVTVQLTSSSTKVQPPVTVSIPPTATAVQFAIATSTVLVNVSATLTARIAKTTSLACSMVIEPLQVVALSIPVNHISGGQNGMAKITLNGHAPAGGFVVLLSSPSEAIGLPKNVSIPALGLSTSFNFGTKALSGGIYTFIQTSDVVTPVTVWGTGLASSGWAQQYGNASATSQAVSPIISSPVQSWSYVAAATVTTQVSIGLDGRLYFGCSDGNLVCLNPDGTLAWKFKTGGGINSTCAIGANGLIYFGSSDGNIYALQATSGALSWNYSNGKSVGSSPTITPDGTVYISPSSTLTLGLNGSNGTVAFKSKNGNFRSDPILAGNGLLVMPANSYGAVGAMSLKDGSVQYGVFPWEFYNSPTMGRPMIGPKGELYEMAGGFDGGGLGESSYYGAWLQGSNWATGNLDVVGPNTSLDFNVEAVAMGSKGIYSADYDFPNAGISLYGFNGKPLDRVSTGLVSSQIVVTSDEGIYVIGSKMPHSTGPASELLAILPSGNTWSIPGTFQSISVSADSSLYVVSGATVTAFTAR